MEENTNHVSDDTRVAIPIRNLISIVAAVAVSTWAYNGINERLSFLEFQTETLIEEIEENDNWIDNFTPPKDVLDTVERVREIERAIAILEVELNNLK